MNELEHNGAWRDDDWVEALLRAEATADAGEYVPDDGFTERVMHAIPAPVALPAWRKPVLVALWTVAATGLAMALPGAVKDVAYDALNLLAAYSFSLRDVALGVAGIAAASWAGTLYTLRQES